MSDIQNNTTRQALDAGIDAARLVKPVIIHEDGREHALIPSGYELHDVTNPHLMQPFIQQSVTVDDRASLTVYTNRFSDDRTIIIADYDKGHITSHLDWHHDNNHDLEPQQSSHSVRLALRDSEEYKRWSKMEGELHSQQEFAFFIEENVADVTDPDSSTLLEICRELEATQGVAFKSGTRLDNGDRAFVYENETHVKNEMVVPTDIRLSIPLYQGEEPTDIRAKFRFRVRQDGLLLGFNWHRVEYQRQAKFNELAYAAAEETGRPVLFGRT